MGEAKWRSNNDPTFGLKPKAKASGNFRGLVISCPITVSETHFSINGSLDPQSLRTNLLFWDQLNWPKNNRVFGKGGIEEELLEQEGILQRIDVNVPGKVLGSVSSDDLGSIILSSHLEGFRRLDKAQPGTWSLSRDINSISFPATDLVQDRGVMVSLYNSLPVPNFDVPLYDILEFKQKRTDELLNLRVELETFYAEITSANDSEQAFRTAQLKMSIALQNHFKAAREFPITWRNSDLTAKLNLNNGILGAAIGGILGHQIGFPEIGAATLAVIGSIKIELGGALSWKKPTKSPYEYVTSYHEEVFQGRK